MLTINGKPAVTLDENKGIVLYCDGSARPNPGYMGWGCHGYIYELKELKKPISVDGFIITTNGYHQPEDKVETPTPVEPTMYFDFIGSSLEQGTNNIAEINALYRSLDRLQEFGAKNIYVRSDSEYTIKGITLWCKEWARNGWIKNDGSPIANLEHWKLAYGKYTELQAMGVNITLQWVKAHSGLLGNVQADTLAAIAMSHSSYKEGITNYDFSDAKGYWKVEKDRHPFICHKNLYFNSVAGFNTPGHYMISDPGGIDAVFGKRIPEAAFSVVRLATPDPILETVKEKQYEISNGNFVLSAMKLEQVYSKHVYPYLERHGKYAMFPDRNNYNINFTDGVPIAIEANPTNLSLRGIEVFNFLEEILNSYLKYSKEGFNQKDNIHELQAHDVTDIFYESIEKKRAGKPYYVKKLHSKYGVGFTDLNIPVQVKHEGVNTEFIIPVSLGTDLPQRNNLKKLEPDDPKISLITWIESTVSIRYAIVIECASGIGLWSNYFADKLFFKS